MNIFKQLRKNYGCTQSELAKMLNVNQTTVSKWENENTIPDYTTLINLSLIYGVSIDTLLGKKQEIIKEQIKENMIIIFDCNGKRKDYQLTSKQIKLFEQLVEEIIKDK